MFELTITPQEARRLAVAAQHLDGDYPQSPHEAMVDVLQRIRCLQIDPIRAVERTQYLVLWSRLGRYDRDFLHKLVYEDRHLFEYWAHAASLVLTEDYPLHELMMRRYPKEASSWGKRLGRWVAENEAFRDYILAEIERRGPLLTSDFEDRSKVPWASGGWSSGRSVSYMIDYLWTRGDLMVARREGLKRWWDLSQRVLPDHAPAGGWTAEAVTRDAAQKSLKALGIGRLRDIGRHFIEGRYRKLKAILPQLVAEGAVLPIAVAGERWKKDDWFIHREMLPTLARIQAGDWHPRTTLLSPFDGLIRDRDRTELMWDFHYRIEIYVPKAKRQYGYYVLPILHGEELIGRIDPKMDYKKRLLTINTIYLEEDAPTDGATGAAVAGAIQSLANFLGAERIAYGGIPQAWQRLMAE